MSQRDQIFRQIDKLIAADVLHGSESLCKLLRYLARHALDQPGAPVKEYQIATEVYGRPADFNPQADSTIRVQAGRLRAKLAEYYASQGADDPIVVELPKGTYLLSFHENALAEAGGHQTVAASGGERTEATATMSRRWAVSLAVLSILLIGSVGVIANLLANRKAGTALTRKLEAPPAALQTFWKPFVTQPEEPWVIFSNAAFIGRPETGMRYYNAAKDPKDRIWDHYTGVGEVLAVHSLDQAFALLGRGLRVKRGSLFSLDDAGNNDLIFVGSPSENLTLLDIPNTREFVFQRVATGPRRGDLGIYNLHPQANEPNYFVASPSGAPLTEDYAVIGFMPGLNPSRSIMILAGTTTFGTEAAVEYVSRQNTVEDLLSRLAVSRGQELAPFEALLRVKITRGVPVESEVVAVRKRAKK